MAHGCRPEWQGAIIRSIVTYSVSVESFDNLAPSWSRLLFDCPGYPVFFTPQWHRNWWEHFGSGEPLLLAVRKEAGLVGVAPLMRTGDGISLLGDGNVSDYLDFIAPAEHADSVAQAVLDFVEPMRWKQFELFSLRPESVVRRYFLPLASRRGMKVTEVQEDVCPQRDLPATWEEYVSLLDRNSRHELRRKQRRLLPEPTVSFQTITSPETLESDMADFLRLFLDSKEAKTQFLTPVMEAFFKDAVRMSYANGWLRLFFLDISGTRAAAAIVFDVGDTYYLYNSGYDKQFSQLSVGLILKARCIEEAIIAGKRRFDFLRGREPYKYDLGGVDQPVYRCLVTRS